MKDDSLATRRPPIGVVENALMHRDADAPWDLETKFRTASEAGVFDYLDIDPPTDNVDEYLALSQKYGLPIRACGYIYMAGRDEALLEQHLQVAARLGSKVLNVQLFRHHAAGHVASNAEIAQFCIRAGDLGEALGCLPCFEAHVDMWSEDFVRVEQVADLVQASGKQFRLTLDPSHIVFKIDNPEEQAVLGLGSQIADGSVVLDPALPESVINRWIDRGLVWHAHARSAVPNNPKNIQARHPNGGVGRGIQYPFSPPGPEQYHAVWDPSRLEPWKRAMRNLLAFHRQHTGSPLGQISVEFIPFADYGGGGGYSIFDNAVACATWLRTEITGVS